MPDQRPVSWGSFEYAGVLWAWLRYSNDVVRFFDSSRVEEEGTPLAKELATYYWKKIGVK